MFENKNKRLNDLELMEIACARDGAREVALHIFYKKTDWSVYHKIYKTDQSV